jgi:hypothetical protein
MFAVIHGIIRALARSYGCVAVGPHIELGDLFAIRLVVLAILHVGQDRLFRFPVSPARSAAKVIGEFFSTKDGSPAMSAFTLHLRDRSYGIRLGRFVKLQSTGASRDCVNELVVKKLSKRRSAI